MYEEKLFIIICEKAQVGGNKYIHSFKWAVQSVGQSVGRFNGDDYVYVCKCVQVYVCKIPLKFRNA